MRNFDGAREERIVSKKSVILSIPWSQTGTETGGRFAELMEYKKMISLLMYAIQLGFLISGHPRRGKTILLEGQLGTPEGS